MEFISDDEIVGRALFEPQWDSYVNRPTPGAFTRSNTSVTRKKDDEENLIKLLKQDVEGGAVVVKAVGLISVKDIKAIGLNDENKILFEVTEEPTELNPLHAEIIPFEDEDKSVIKSKVSRGVSKKIGAALEILVLDSSGSVLERKI